ncbi:MAG: hypothetical protein IT376_13950 [Polyangiaceae bacterium]|nr:hypothetical protein [Polyangiaceae bacterium]
MKKRHAVAAALAATALSGTALGQGQPWLSDRRMGQGAGVRAGDIEIHPGIAGEVGYDSNYFKRAGTDSEPVYSAARIRVTPHLNLSTLSGPRVEGATPSNVQFETGVFAVYNEIIPMNSGDFEGKDQRRLDLGANLKLTIAPQSKVGGDLYGDFARVGEPSDTPDPEFAYDRSALRAGAGVTWRPGGGLFEWRLGYEFLYNFFARENFQDFDNTTHAAKTRGRFRFLPRTAIFYDATFGVLSYRAGSPANGGEFVNSRLGLKGLVTNRFAFMVSGGWASSFYEAQVGPIQDYDSFTAQTEVRYFLIPQAELDDGSATVGLSSIAAGYTRSFANGYLGNYFGRDRGYAEFAYFVGGIFALTLQGGYSNYSYPDSYRGNGAVLQPAFNQGRADATIFGEYRLTDGVGIFTTFRYNAVLTKTVILADPAVPASADDLSYSRLEAYLGLRWFL